MAKMYGIIKDNLFLITFIKNLEQYIADYCSKLSYNRYGFIVVNSENISATPTPILC